jgi:hypothetical protein
MGYRPQDWKKWNGIKQSWKPIIGDELCFDPSPWLAWRLHQREEGELNSVHSEPIMG